LMYNSRQMIDAIRSKVADDLFEFSKHAVDQSILRNISLDEFRESIENAAVIEDYPNDKYDPSCLVLGLTKMAVRFTYNVLMRCVIN
jgi:hypothetical protein